MLQGEHLIGNEDIGVYSVHLKSNLITQVIEKQRPQRTFENVRSLLLSS